MILFDQNQVQALLFLESWRQWFHITVFQLLTAQWEWGKGGGVLSKGKEKWGRGIQSQAKDDRQSMGAAVQTVTWSLPDIGVLRWMTTSN